MYVQNKLPLPQFLLLENTVVPDFCVNIHFVYSFTFFFLKKKCTGCQFLKKASELKL